MTRFTDRFRSGGLTPLVTLVLLTWAGTVYAQQDAGSVYLQAREHLIEERFGEALSLFRTVVSEYPESSRADDAQYYIGYTLERMGRNEEAVAAYEELIRRWPESVRLESARSHLMELMGEGGQPGQVPLDQLLSDRTPWEFRREMALVLARSGDFSAASIMEEVMRRESSSRQQELIRALGGHLSDPSARRILGIALEPSRSSSVQLIALRTLKPVAAEQDVALLIETAITRNNPSSVQMEAIQVLSVAIDRPHARRVVLRCLEPGNGSSVQLMAIRALNRHLLEEDVRPSIIKLYMRSESSSVQLEALNALKGEQNRLEIRGILVAAVDNRNSSSVQLAAMRIARSSNNADIRRVARSGLASGIPSSVQLEAVRALAGGRNEEEAAEALEAMLKERNMSSSVQLEGLKALGNHLETRAAPRAVAAALEDRMPSSVQLEAMDLAAGFATVEPVKSALLELLQPGSTPSSVQLKAVRLLGRQIDDDEVRRIIGQALHYSNPSSVQLAAVEALETLSRLADVRQILIGSLVPRYPSSVVLKSVRILEEYVREDPRVRGAFIEAMREKNISTRVRVVAAEALLPQADNSLKRQIVDSMEDVIERRWQNMRRNRLRSRDDTLYDAIDVVRAIDPERARELERRYGKPPTLLQRLFGGIIPEGVVCE